MLVGSLMISLVLGLGAAAVSLFAGAGLLAAFGIYVGVGSGTLVLVSLLVLLHQRETPPAAPTATVEATL